MCDHLPCISESSPFLENGSKSLLNDHYRILKPISQGGFGKTFLAVDENRQKSQLCVIKQFLPQCHLQHYQQAVELFKQESLHLAQLGHHPQIPKFLDTFEQDGKHYIVQEWIEGQTLEQELATAGVFAEIEIWQLLQQLLPVLQFVHDHQVIHRDIKPANIIRRRGDRQLVLVDFGAAKYASREIPAKTGTLIGSAEYAAPEQIQGQAIFASDLYSLGVTCLYLLTQVSPFDLYDCSEETWIWQKYLPEPISPTLRQILGTMLQRAIKRRYQSAAEVLLDVNALPKQVLVPYPATEYAASISIAAQLDLHAIAPVTIFDPQTQTWYYLPPKMNTTKDTYHNKKNTSSHLETALSIASVICLTFTSLALGTVLKLTTHTLRSEQFRTTQEFVHIGQK
jgi:serine/threonine protein kinase